ncbi:MAG TPA: GMC oxidoreductase [Pyrinomonadaceae bacterium]
MSAQVPHYAAVVIGSGFGGCMTALPLARKFAERDRGEKVLILERGTWWTTPVNTVQDQEVKTYTHLMNNGQPVQLWSSLNHFRGFVDIFTRCFRRHRNEDGLFEMTFLGKRGFLGLFGNQNDGVSIIRGNGVGGGSLVYSNITIRPPNVVLDDPRWPVEWKSDKERDDYFDLARQAIGRGILWALNERAKAQSPNPFILQASAPNTGLSNIVTRVAGLNPHWVVKPDPLNAKRGLKHINTPRTPLDATSPGLPPDDDKRDFKNDLWLARARVFQSAMEKLTADFGTVDLSINDYKFDLDPKEHGKNQYDDKGVARNFCDRQGRCNVGCLPGARHTLNKQLMAAMYGTPKHPEPVFHHKELQLEPLAEVDVIVARPQGGYEIHYLQRDRLKTESFTRKSVTADRVILAAGCLGTSEIMLRCKERGTLPNLSDKVGFGFSTNGDYLAFLDGTQERVSLVRGPVTTSFGHFNTGEAGTGGDAATFHTIEDQGVPPALASVIGVGVPLIRSLANGRDKKLFIIWAILLRALRRVRHYFRALRTNFRERQDIFRSDDEVTAKMMCIVAMGRDASVGQFRLGKSSGESRLRVKRNDGREFHEDPIYDAIKKSLDRLAEVLSPAGKKGTFENPLLNSVSNALKANSIALSHPLGGCIMGADASRGVVDQYGRVFDQTKTNSRPFYEGLYIADAAIIPTALGVNPSLTISTLALRIADKIIEELPPVPNA